jgi:hypothetical protein
MQLVSMRINRFYFATGFDEVCRMREDQRSGCPINLSLEVFSDRWSLIVIRDMMFGNRRHFRVLLPHSEEGPTP